MYIEIGKLVENRKYTCCCMVMSVALIAHGNNNGSEDIQLNTLQLAKITFHCHVTKIDK